MFKIKKKLIFTIFIFLILIFSTTLTNAKVIEKKSNDSNNISCEFTNYWTLMFYLAFDNHRESEIDWTIDFLKDVGSGYHRKIVILVDGKTNGDTCYGHIQDNMFLPDAWYESESNMSSAKTFKRFLQTSMYNYPAENYALFVLSTHGSGWQGLGVDTYGTGSSASLSLLDMKDYKEVLSEVTNNGTDKIDIVALDICVTGSIEVAYQLSPYVNYMLANEEHGFGGPDEYSDDGYLLGWNYSGFLNQLRINPDISAESFSKSIVDTYKAGTYIAKFGELIPAPKFYPINQFHTVLSATNLSKINEISKAVSNLSKALSDNLGQFRKEIKKARIQTREYGKLYRKFWWLPARLSYIMQFEPLSYDCFIDLYDFAEKLIQKTNNKDINNASKQTMKAINSTIFACESEPDDPSHGLFIYFPKLKCQYDKSIWGPLKTNGFKNLPVKYEDLMFSIDTGWDNFIKDYLLI